MLDTQKLINLVKLEEIPKKLNKTDINAIKALHYMIYKLKNNHNFTNKQIYYFLQRLPNRLKKSNHNLYNLDTKKSVAIQGTGKISRMDRPYWLSTGSEINGQCITSKVAESPNSAKESILSNILLENVPKQYYVNNKKLNKILKQ